MQIVRTLGLVGHALFTRHVLDAFTDQCLRLGVGLQRYAQSGSSTGAGVVVRRGTNAAAAQHYIARGKSTLQGGGEACRVVAQVLGVGQCKTALAQQFDNAWQVFVGTFTRQDFIADDDQAKGWGHGGALRP